MINVDALRKHINRRHSRLQVVSFDIFDTLLIRSITPERVMKIAAQKLSESLGKPEIFPELLESRVQFKHDMDALYASGREAEWTVSQWLAKLSREIDTEFISLISKGRKAELYAEEIGLRLAKETHDALAYVQEQGLRSIAVSDTWLDQSWLEELLQRFSLSFENVFSSGTFKASKRRGTIFPVIEKELKLESGAFLHVGDNLKADWLKPRLAGWKSLWMLQNSKLYTQVMPNRLKNTLLKSKNHHDIVQSLHIPSQNSSDPYYDLAYNDLARLLIIFALVQWRRFISQNIDVAFYLARDARCMLDVYDLIADLLPGSCPRRYIRLSRKAVALVHPRDYLVTAQPVAGKVGRKTVTDWLSNFGLEKQLVHQILNGAGLKADSPFSEQSRKKLREACQDFLPAIELAQMELRRIISDFFVQQAGMSGFKRIGIVDSGWACTIQDTIRGILDEIELVSGIYFGVSNQGYSPNSKNRKYGLLRDDFRSPNHFNPLEATAGVIRMWDTLLREPTGTVIGFKVKDSGKIIPILSETKAIGKLEMDAAESISKGIRQGTLERRKYIALLVNISDQLSQNDFERAATEIARKLSTNPTFEHAKAIMRLGFDEGTAKDKKGSFGLGGVLDGVAWYPGILTSLRLGWLSPVMEKTVSILLQKKMRTINNQFG